MHLHAPGHETLLSGLSLPRDPVVKFFLRFAVDLPVCTRFDQK